MPVVPLRRALVLSAAAAGLPRALSAQGGVAAPSAASAASAAANTLMLGVVPNLSARLLAALYQPLRSYLEGRLALTVQVVTAASFRSFHQRALDGAYGLFITTPNLGALAAADAQAQLLGVFEPGVAALAVALSGRADEALAALPGRKLALANPASLVALRGLLWLRTLGLEAGRDFEVVRAPNEDSLAHWLDSGEAPLALMSRGELNQLTAPRREALAAVQQFATLPGFMAMVPAGTRPERAAQLRQGLVDFLASPVADGFRQASGMRGLRPLSRDDRAELDPVLDATRRALLASADR